MLASLLGCAGPPSGAVDYAVVGADEILVGAWTPGAPASVVRLGSERVNDTALAALDGDEVDDLLIANRDGDDGIWAYAGVPGAYPDEEPRVRFGPAESSFLTVVGVDVDGDGVSEVLGGAWGADDPSTEDGEVGAVYVFDGGIEADVAAADARGVFYGTVHRTENGWMEESTGRRLDPGADLDGDGLPEVLVTGTTWLWAAPLGARGAHRLDEVALAVGAPGVQLGSDDDAGALYLWQASTLARL